MNYTVILSERAVADLVALARWIESQTNRDTARAYIARIDIKIATLQDYPERGTPRPKVRHDLRSVSFERRRIIYYRIFDDKVWVERIVDGRRDQRTAFTEQPNQLF